MKSPNCHGGKNLILGDSRRFSEILAVGACLQEVTGHNGEEARLDLELLFFILHNKGVFWNISDAK